MFDLLFDAIRTEVQVFYKLMKDRFNGGLLQITYFAVLHVFLKKSEILLAFSRYQVMYSAFRIVPSVKLTYK